MKKIAFLIIAGFISISLFSCATVNHADQGANSDAGMVVIPEGWFIMGSDSGEFNEKPEHEVFLDTFKMDRYEVSAKDFAEFLNAKGNPDNKYFTHDNYSTVIGVSYNAGEEVETIKNPQRYIPRKGFENYPANNVSWYGAYGYCKWKGKRLPSEAEWEKAARSNDRRRYPWGNSMPDNTKARFAQEWGKKGMDVMVPVDAMPEGASYYGLLNMSGNVWEWVADWYRQNYCNFCDPGGGEYYSAAEELLGIKKTTVKRDSDMPPKYNAHGPSIGSFKVLRGGSWSDSAARKIRSSFRYWLDPMERYNNSGIRCAR